MTKKRAKTTTFPCNRYGAERVGEVLLKARLAKGWVLRDLRPHGICPGTANHYESGLLNKYMNERVVSLLLQALEPLNQTTGQVWTLEEIKSLVTTSRQPH